MELLIMELLITELLITELLITELLITELLITELLITELLITELLITELLITELLIIGLLSTRDGLTVQELIPGSAFSYGPKVWLGRGGALRVKSNSGEQPSVSAESQKKI
jgi:hypothetical protein